MAILAVGCAAGAGGKAAKVADDYGYSENNPIKVGGVGDGPANERAYLNRLKGPNGERITYTRNGSCCHFETSKGFLGMGLLDIYMVTVQGDSVPKKLYINMYDKAKLYAPKGFLIK
ncbi:2-dehydro-3-deoxyphosphooctonate aldolase [Flavobacterium zepuense]|uniref:2-dehydro-3-deoxyphosphooctonate aldolase n=2 Tax=Flavobacterium zepuense TaxID=2593302 RepID=A0A552V338_9FLAO|nr:2-dehydro-3-deoxyphosphooctonate aldolase [Flavobacterium zepuense]